MRTVSLLALCLLISCANLPPNQAQLVGEWRYSDKARTCHYVFEKNGQFHGEVTLNGKLVSKFTGRWSVQGDSLLYSYSGDEFHRIPAGSTDRDKLLSVRPDSFKIEAADGSQRVYLRIR